MIVPLMLALFLADPKADQALVDAWLKVSLDHASGYAITPRDQPERSFRRLPQAVFRHSQPVRGDDIGAVYLWVDDASRPAVIGTTFAYTQQGDIRNVVHEFHSLADSPLTVNWRDQPSSWRPETPGLTWQRIDDAPPADKTPAGRQRQARALARRFGAASTDHNGGRWELRLVPKPLHQFDAETSTTMRSGQLSAFCQGTDPELILLLEIRAAENGAVWHFAAASFTDYAVTLKLEQKEVWSAPAHSTGRTNPHWAEAISQERLPTNAE